MDVMINRHFLSYKAFSPPWFLEVILGTSLLGSLFFYFVDPSGTGLTMMTGHPEGDHSGLISLVTVFSAFVVFFAVLIMVRCIPVLMKSSSEDRVAKAAGLIKTTLWLALAAIVLAVAAYMLIPLI
jgi:hypothetical protein